MNAGHRKYRAAAPAAVRQPQFVALEARRLLSTMVVDINDPTANDLGDNLYTQIHEAVAAASPGDTIQVRGGTYEPFGVPTNNLTIRAAEGDVVVDAMGVLDGVTVKADSVTIQGLTVANAIRSGFQIAGNGNMLRGNTASNNRLFGFRIQTLGPPQPIADNTLIGNRAAGNGIGFLALGDDTTVLGNQAEGNSNLQFLTRGNRNRIIGNSAINGLTLGFQIEGDGGTITGNTATGNAQAGFNVVRSHHSAFGGNHAKDNGGGGFVLLGGADNTLRGNVAQGNTQSGFVVSAVASIRVEVIDPWARTARLILDSAETSEKNLFQGNRAHDNGAYGFHLLGAGGNTLQGNSARGNGSDGFRLEKRDIVVPPTFSGFTMVNAGELLATFQSEDNVIQANTSKANGGYGFFSDEPMSNLFEHNNAQGNALGDYSFL